MPASKRRARARAWAPGATLRDASGTVPGNSCVRPCVPCVSRRPPVSFYRYGTPGLPELSLFRARPNMTWHSPVYFSRMLHGRGVCRLASPQVIAASISTAGGLFSQLVLEARTEVNKRRLLASTCLGGLIDGLMLQRWYALLHSLHPRQDSAAIIKRLLLHHVVFAPVFAVPVFVVLSNACARNAHSSAWRAALDQLQQSWGPAVLAHALIVAPMQMFNAFHVPAAYSVLCANGVAFVWAIALSWYSHHPVIVE